MLNHFPSSEKKIGFSGIAFKSSFR